MASREARDKVVGTGIRIRGLLCWSGRRTTARPCNCRRDQRTERLAPAASCVPA